MQMGDPKGAVAALQTWMQLMNSNCYNTLIKPTANTTSSSLQIMAQPLNTA